MILGESDGGDYMTDGPDNLQYGAGDECYSAGDLSYEPRQLRGGDLNNNHIGQPNRNQQHQQNNPHQHSTGQSQAASQFNGQPTSHLNLVQFVDQFNSNFNCNSLMPSLSNQPQQQSQNIANNNQMFCSSLADQCKEAGLSNLIGPGGGPIKIKTENAIDLSNSTNAPANLSSCLPNSSSTHLTSLPNLSTLSNTANMSIPLITNQISLNSIHCEKGNQANQKAMLAIQQHSTNDPNGVPASHGLPISLASNLPVNFNEFLLNDYPPGQLNLAQASNEPPKCPNSLEQSNKINSNNELSPIDMEDQERIKLERKRMRNRWGSFWTAFWTAL